MMQARALAVRAALASLGAVLASVAVALSAYASHGIADPHARWQATLAAAWLFAHGLALAALPIGRTSTGLMALVALMALALGTALFSGSLAGAALFDWPTRLAPAGGILMMAGWLAAAAALWRERSVK